MPTPHMFPLAEAMVAHVGQVRFLTLAETDPARVALGWAATDSASVVQAHAPDAAAALALIAGFDGPDDMHVLPGIKPVPWLRPVQLALRRSQARIVVMGEAALPQTGLRKVARFMRDRVLATRWRGRVERVLAMGAIGAAHYREIGFPAAQVRDFGYFPALSTATSSEQGNAGVRLVFAGALIRRKGLDLVLDALSSGKLERWTLRVAGDGPERMALHAQALERGLAPRIEWLGAVPGSAVPAILAAADLALVPSRFDGWGAVTNDALGVGTPVLASDRCGSAAVLTRPELGTVFAAGNPVSLAEALGCFIAGPKHSPIRRDAIRGWAHKTLSPAAGAVYLARLLAGDSDASPPWCLSSNPGN